MANKLTRLEEFEKILADYHIAEAGKEVLTKTRLVLLIGVSGTGRDTIIRELLKSGEYYYIASDTTRQPRVNDGVPEQNGVEYWFRTEEEFLSDLKAGKLLEAEIIHANAVYGISIRELAKANEQQKIAITDVDLNIKAIVGEKQDTHAFMVLPPNFDEWMRRWSGRGEISADERRRRLETASKIFKAGMDWDFFTFIVNHKVAEAAAAINAAVQGKPDTAQQEEGRRVINELYKQTQQALAQ